jgi:hypothetical protein
VSAVGFVKCSRDLARNALRSRPLFVASVKAERGGFGKSRIRGARNAKAKNKGGLVVRARFGSVASFPAVPVLTFCSTGRGESAAQYLAIVPRAG